MNFHVSESPSTGDCKKLALQNVTLANMSVRKLTCQRPPPFLQVRTLKLMTSNEQPQSCLCPVSTSRRSLKEPNVRSPAVSKKQPALGTQEAGRVPRVPKSPGSKPPIYPVNEETLPKKKKRPCSRMRYLMMSIRMY